MGAHRVHSQAQKGSWARVRWGEADQGLTHHSRDPSGGHVPGPEFCPAMSRMVAFQGGSLAEGGMERQEEMRSCPLCEDGGGARVLTRDWNLMVQSYLSKVSPGQQRTLILRLLLCGQTDNSDNGRRQTGGLGMKRTEDWG